VACFAFAWRTRGTAQNPQSGRSRFELYASRIQVTGVTALLSAQFSFFGFELRSSGSQGGAVGAYPEDDSDSSVALRDSAMFHLVINGLLLTLMEVSVHLNTRGRSEPP
jgi:hypothetical protein